MPRGKEKQKDQRRKSLDRWPGENIRQHRAMLLFAMQSPGRKRSKRATARAIGVTEGSIRNWSRNSRWMERIENQGTEVDKRAYRLYNELYMAEWGALELPEVAHKMTLPIAGAYLGDLSASRAHNSPLIREESAKYAGMIAEKTAAQAVVKRRHDNRAAAEKHLKLVDATLGLIAKKLKDKDLRVTARDIPMMLECRERLVSIAMGNAIGGSTAVVESARVKHAKETGGDVIEALWEDTEDLRVILGALRIKATTDVTEVSARNAQYEAEREQRA